MRQRLLCVGVALLCGCGSSPSSPTGEASAPAAAPEAPLALLGQVFLTRPVSGAALTVTDRSGAQTKATTGPGGTFRIELKAPVAPLQVDVQVPGENATLSAIVDQWPLPHAFLGVDAASTLTTRYRRTHPDLSGADAEARVKRFLQLPSHARLGQTTMQSDYGFSHRTLLSAAAQRGGLDPFLDTLVAQVDSGATVTFSSQRLKAEPVRQAGLDDNLGVAAARFIGGKLVDTAYKYVETYSVGWIMAQLGLGGSGSTVTLQAIQDQLNQIQAQLTKIEGDLTQALQLLNLIEITTLQTGVKPVLDFISASYANSQIYSDQPGTLQALQNVILTQHPDMVVSLDTALLSGPQGAGILDTLLANLPNFVTQESLNPSLAALQFYTGQEALACNLLNEALHAKNNPGDRTLSLGPGDLRQAELNADQLLINLRRAEFRLPAVDPYPPLGQGRQPDNLGDGYVLDRQNHLEWMRSSVDGLTYDEASALTGDGGQTILVGMGGWRLPTVAEMQSLGAGFDHLKELGFWTDKMASGYYWTSDPFTHNVNQDTDGGTFTLYTEVGHSTYNVNTGAVGRGVESITNNPYGALYEYDQYVPANGPVTPAPVTPVLFVRDVYQPGTTAGYYEDVPTGLEIQEVSRGTGSVQYRCLRHSHYLESVPSAALRVFIPDDSFDYDRQVTQDVTGDVLWSLAVNGVTDLAALITQAHISNSPSNPGLLTIRDLPAGATVTVSASLADRPARLTPFPTGQDGLLQASANVTSPPAADSSVAAVVVSPITARVANYNFDATGTVANASVQLSALAVRGSGTVSDVTQNVTWSVSAPPSQARVTITGGGVALITITNGLQQQAVLTVTASYQGTSGTTRLVLPRP